MCETVKVKNLLWLNIHKSTKICLRCEEPSLKLKPQNMGSATVRLTNLKHVENKHVGNKHGIKHVGNKHVRKYSL